jgi:hypothetical protein
MSAPSPLHPYTVSFEAVAMALAGRREEHRQGLRAQCWRCTSEVAEETG